MAWRELERRKSADVEINDLLDRSILSEENKLKKLLTRTIHVVIFQGKRGLPFRGTCQRIGDVNNGNFLGILELLGHYDPLLQARACHKSSTIKTEEGTSASPLLMC